MKHSPIHRISILALTIVLVCVFCVTAHPEEVKYGVASWPESMGNHRAHIRVETRADAVHAHIPWRRRDAAPQDRSIVVVESATGKRITNVAVVAINREYGEIVFQSNESGDYNIYYMLYLQPESTASNDWLERNVRADRWKIALGSKANRDSSSYRIRSLRSNGNHSNSCRGG